jgi:hypothetical protein
MRKPADPLRATARWVGPAMRGFGRRVIPLILLIVVSLGLAGAVMFGRSAPVDVDPIGTEREPGFGAVIEAPTAMAESAPSAASELEQLLSRAARAAHLWDEVEAHVQREIGPIEQVLLDFRPDTVLVRRIALALVAEARRVDLDPRVLLAVLLVENPWLDPTARSFVGATGLMQVMPMHVGQWPPCGPDLVAIESNICYGARIFAHYYHQQGGNVERALLRYNGCVHGTNTPTCHTYPDQVFARAGRASLLGWLRPHGIRAASP